MFPIIKHSFLNHAELFYYIIMIYQETNIYSSLIEEIQKSLNVNEYKAKTIYDLF